MPAEEPDGQGGDLEALLERDEATRVRVRPQTALVGGLGPVLGLPAPPSGPRDLPRCQIPLPQALDEAARALSAAAGAPPPPPPERLEHARTVYGALQRAAFRAVADLAALQARVAQLLGELGALAAQRTAAEHGFSDPVQLLDK